MKLTAASAAIMLTACTLKLAAQSPEVKFLVDTTISIMKANSINANQVDWTRLQRETLQQSKDVQDPYQLGPVIRYLYQSLNDFHGWFNYKDSSFQWHRKSEPVPDAIMIEWKKPAKIVARMLDRHIAYLRVPSISYGGREGDDQSAQRLNDSLCSLLSQHPKGMILDLRLDGGGAMFPMICGLEQLIEPGQIGTFLPSKTRWILEDNSFSLDTQVMAHIVPRCSEHAQHIPLVVLIGRGTGSSGEFLTIAFKGRKHMVMMGNETAGFVTSTRQFPINDAASVLVSTGYGADRNGKEYKDAILPDITVNGDDNFNDLKQDAKVQAAMDWIIHRSH